MAQKSKRSGFSLRPMRDVVTGEVLHFKLEVDGELTDEHLERIRMLTKLATSPEVTRRYRATSASQQAFRRGTIEREQPRPAKGITKAEFDRELKRLLSDHPHA